MALVLMGPGSHIIMESMREACRGNDPADQRYIREEIEYTRQNGY